MKLKNSGISGTNRSSTNLPTYNLKKKKWIGITIHKRDMGTDWTVYFANLSFTVKCDTVNTRSLRNKADSTERKR